MTVTRSFGGGRSPAARQALGIGLILAMGVCFASLDTTAKYLGQTLPVVLLLWGRYAVQAVVMAVWLGWRWARGRGSLFVAAHPRFQVVRGSLLLLTSALLFAGIQHMPVAEFTAVGMLTPVITTVFAALFLRERLSLWRGLLVLGGFAGAVIVVRPGSGLFGWAAVVPLVMAVVYALFQLLTRRLSGLEHPLTTHFYTGLIGTLIMSAVMWVAPVDLVPAVQAAPAGLLALLVMGGLFGTAGHLFLILAIGLAPMAVLMPFTFLQIGMASFTGWLAFGHVPDAWAFAGMAVVAACGAASVWLNFRDAQAAKPAASDAAPIND